MANPMTSDEDALSLGGQAELYRRKLVQVEQSLEAMINLLKGEVATMQRQLSRAYIRINELVEENAELKERLK
jgi:hypothetical protein